MKIGYTYHGISQKVGGVSRYFFEIISRLKGEFEIEVITRFSNNLYFKEILNHNNEFFYNTDFRGKQTIFLYLQDKFLRQHLKRNSYDIIHHMGEDSRVFDYARKTPVVITIHDMIPELYNTNVERIENRKISIMKADSIICVSENTKLDLLNIYPEINRSKISVIYHGFDKKDAISITNTYGKYILFVGTRDPHKNFGFMLKSIAEKLKKREIKLICTGSSFTETEKELIDELGVQGNVLNSGFVSEDELSGLYANAICLVYPSLYEGFGFPILEGFLNKCPICISNTSCFPEIAGDAACYFDPKNPDSLSESVSKVLDDPVYRHKLIEKGSKRLDLFSWDESTKLTFEVYKRALLND